MKIEFLTKNYTPSEKLKSIIEKKVQRLDKFFDDEVKVKIVLKEEKGRKDKDEMFSLEMTILLDGAVMRAEVSGPDMYSNIDMALPKIEKQIIRHHKKLASKIKKGRVKDITTDDTIAVVEEEEAKLVRSKSYALAPMTVDDAIEELELVGHAFYVFLNSKTNSVNVLYARKDGNYGLIETVI